MRVGWRPAGYAARVTAYDGSSRAGCLAGFTTQVSIDPARFLVCVSEQNHPHRIVAGAATAAVHALRVGGRAGRRAGAGGLRGVVRGPHPRTPPARRPHRLLLEPFGGTRPGGADLLRFAHVRDLEPGHEA